MSETIQKWVANGFFLFAMICLLSPTIASTSVSPWVAFFISNAVYLYDSIRHRNWPWMWLCIFCGVWHSLIIVSRITHSNPFVVFDPLLTLLETLP